MKRSIRYTTIIICIIFLFLSFHTDIEAKNEAPKTSFIVLVDLSKSWFDPSNNSRKVQIKRTIDQVNESIINLSNRLQKPLSIIYLPIDSASILQEPICELLYQPTLIGKDRKAIRTKSDLERNLKLCNEFILTKNYCTNTDISGAITLAVKISDSPSIKNKFIIILSDMKEELQSGFSASIPDLKGYTIAIIYHIMPEDAPTGAMDSRLNKWKEMFINKNAERTILIIDKANFGNSLSSKLGDDNGS